MPWTWSTARTLDRAGIADQVDAAPFGFGQTSVTISPGVVIDMRAVAAQLPDGGLPGRATIRAVRDVGVAVRDQRMYELDLDVQPDGRPQYLLTHLLLVPAEAAARLALGASLPVQVSPQVPSQLVVDWDSP